MEPHMVEDDLEHRIRPGEVGDPLQRVFQTLLHHERLIHQRNGSIQRTGGLPKLQGCRRVEPGIAAVLLFRPGQTKPGRSAGLHERFELARSIRLSAIKNYNRNNPVQVLAGNIQQAVSSSP